VSRVIYIDSDYMIDYMIAITLITLD
jgi:hypothetical protein